MTTRASTARLFHRTTQRREQRRRPVPFELRQKKGQHGAFRAGHGREVVTQRVLGFFDNHIDCRALEVALENDRMNITFAADAGSVAEALGDPLHGGHDIFPSSLSDLGNPISDNASGLT